MTTALLDCIFAMAHDNEEDCHFLDYQFLSVYSTAFLHFDDMYVDNAAASLLSNCRRCGPPNDVVPSKTYTGMLFR